MSSFSFVNGTASHFIEMIDEEDSIFLQSETFSNGVRQEFTTATDVTGTGFADMIFGGYTDDTMRGGDGDDVIASFEGNDQLFGGTGNDTFMFHYGDGNDEVTVGDGADTIFFGDVYTDELILERLPGDGLKISVLGEDQEITVNDFFDIDNGNNSLMVRSPFSGEMIEYDFHATLASLATQNELLSITGGITEDATSVRDIFFEAAELRPDIITNGFTEDATKVSVVGPISSETPILEHILHGGIPTNGILIHGKSIGGEFDPINDFEPEIA